MKQKCNIQFNKKFFFLKAQNRIFFYFTKTDLLSDTNKHVRLHACVSVADLVFPFVNLYKHGYRNVIF